MKNIFDDISVWLANVAKQVEKEAIEEIEKAKQKQNKNDSEDNMKLLDNDCEALLKEILDDSNFPMKLCRNFELLNEPVDGNIIRYKEDEILRAKVKVLIDEGFITVSWAGDKPYCGRIEQKGRSYFEMKEKEDTKNYSSWEKLLYKLLKNDNELHQIFHIELTNDEKTTIRELERRGLIDKLIFAGMSGAGFRFTYSGLHWLEDRNNAENILKQAKIIQNNQNIYGNVSNSNIQQGTANSSQSMEINYDQVSEVLKEIKTNIEKLQLSMDNQVELLEMIESTEENCKKKKKGVVKTLLSGICTFINNFASGVASGLLVAKIQGLI